MCYKEEKHRKISMQLEEKFNNTPDFISNFFIRYKSAATKNCNWGYIRDLLQWLIEKKYIKQEYISNITTEDMQKIKPEQIAEYFEDIHRGITRRKNTLNSINTKKNVFSAFWSYMVNREYVKKNIIRDDSLKNKFKTERNQKIVITPTDEQVEKFICKLNDGNQNEFNIIRNITIVKLIMGSGIRSEELINLDIKDLHLNGGRKEDGVYTNRPYINILGKGKIEEYDSVYISKDARQCIDDYLKQREIFINENHIQDNALFLSNKKRRISKTSITSFFDRYSNGEIFPHALRHWVGTKLYEKTKDIVLVQKQLRHSSLETAAKYYVHMDENKIADAMAEL